MEAGVGRGGPTPGRRWLLINTAQTWGWTNEAQQTLWQTAEKFPSDKWPLEVLERGYFRAGDTKGLFRVYSAKLERQPKDLVAKNDLAAVSLLLKTNLTRARAFALDAYTLSPTNTLTAATYAFSLYQQGKAKEGLEVLRKFDENQLQQPSMALVYTLLLSAVGETEQAKTFRTFAEKGPLPEERVLLNR